MPARLHLLTSSRVWPTTKGSRPNAFLVDAAVFERKRGGLAVGDHNDLPHVLFLAEQDALRHAQALRACSCNTDRPGRGRGSPRGTSSAEVVKEDKASACRRGGVLRSNEMREERHGHALGGREAVLPRKESCCGCNQEGRP